MSERALTTIPFRGSTLAAIAGPTPETTMVAIKPMVDGMRLPWEAQRQRLMRHPVLRTCACVMQVQLPGDTQAREVVFLALTRVHFFLGTIQPDRVKDPDARAEVIAFQEEAADVLFGHFFGKAAKAVGVDIPDPDDIAALPIMSKVRIIDCYRLTLGVRAAQEIMLRLKMPVVPVLEEVMQQQADLFRRDQV